MTESSESAPLDVLVVDDDPAVARLVRVVLEREGLRVEHAHDASAARKVLDARACRVVLTDYTMPDVNGLQLVRSLEAAGVGAAFLVMSAFLEQPVVQEICSEPAVAGMIHKPFELKELVRDVRAALGSSADVLPAGATCPPSSDPARAAAPEAERTFGRGSEGGVSRRGSAAGVDAEKARIHPSAGVDSPNRRS